MYKKCDRYKEGIRDYVREEAKKDLKQMMLEILANLDVDMILQ